MVEFIGMNKHMAKYLDEAVENDENQDSKDMDEIQKELRQLHEGDEPQHILQFKSWKSEKIQEEEKKG